MSANQSSRRIKKNLDHDKKRDKRQKFRPTLKPWLEALEDRLAPAAVATLASFNPYPNGASPQAGVIEDSSGNLFGTTIVGGAYGYGSVFEVAAGSNTITTRASFNNTNGANPQGALVQDSNGNLFGTAFMGGASGFGTVFEVAAGSNTITTLASFNNYSGAIAGLLEDSSGNLFGTTVFGGASNAGTVFEVVAGSGAITTLASFTGSNGATPEAGLVKDSSGNLFGTTVFGGASGYGTVFKVAAGAGTITTLASFNSTTGQNPVGSLVLDSSGNLFGTTQNGGPYGVGTVFEVSAGSNTITTLAFFNSTNGHEPHGLVQDSQGNLFGTAAGRPNYAGAGTVFEVAAGSNLITNLAFFNFYNGQNPAGGLVVDSSGNVFGTTSATDGSHGAGTVFEVAAGSGTITTLASFNVVNGRDPRGSLVEDGSGNLFGTTQNGGPNDVGTVYEMAAGSNTITTLASFNTTNGSFPDDGLVEDSSGNLLGTTFDGGASGYGTVFEVTAGSNTITTLASFNNTNGANPLAALVEDSSGNLFGTTTYGGANNAGTVFEVVAGSGAITTLASFTGSNGANPEAGLVNDSSGNLFGTTVSGGASGYGTVFEVSAGSNAITTLASFNGFNLEASLVEDSSGNLFGFTRGPNDVGTVYEMAAGSNTITTLASFNAGAPTGLVEDGLGNLYGTSGRFLFELPAASSAIAVFASFDGDPSGGLLRDSSGYLLGTTVDGGASGYGTVFEIPVPLVKLAATTPAIPDPNQPANLLTNATSLSYAVTFASPVTGVDASDFVLATTGTVATTSIQVQPVAGSNGAAYSVTISGITGNGTLGLNIMDNGGIRNLAGKPLAPGSGNAVGQVYNIDQVPPTVAFDGNTPGNPDPYNAGALLSSASTLSYTIAFSKPVTGVNPSDFVPARTGTIAAALLQVQPIAGTNGTEYALTVSGITGNGTLGISLADDGAIRDLAGNGIPQGTGTVFGQVYTIVSDPPVVQSFVGTTPANPDPNNPGALITNASSVSYTLTFSKPVTGVVATDFTVQGFATASIQVIPLAASNGAAYTVTVNGLTNGSACNVIINTLTNIKDLSGYAFTLTAAPTVSNVNGFPLSQTYTIDQVPPVALAITPITRASPAALVTSASSVSYAVTFSKTVTGVDPTDFALTETGTAAATSIQTNVDPNNPDNWIVTISGVTGDGTLGLKVAGNNHILDLAGNALSQQVAPVSIQSLPTMQLGSGQNLMGVADITGNGKDDLIIANSLTGSISVMLGNGDGTFQSPQPFAAGQGSLNGVVHDVNGDGKPDLVMVNSGTDTVSVFLNNGNGTFAPAQTYVTSNDGSTLAESVAVADVNGDGKPDLVVANGSNVYVGNVSVLLNNGNGTFQAPQTLIGGGSVVNADSVAVADVNGDGKPDIVVGTGAQYVIDYYNRPSRVELLLNNGSGNFVDSQNLASPNVGANPVPVALSDLNGGGKPDVVFSTSSGATVAELNDGNGTFTNALPLTQFGAPGSLPIGADLTGRGKVEDLVVGNLSANTVSVFVHVAPVYTIEDVTPTAHIAVDPTATPAADKANLLLSATDATSSQELAAGFTYAINWGDGGLPQTVVATANNGNGVPVAHTYAVDGSYVVSVMATDTDGAVSSPATGLVVVSSKAGDRIALGGGASAGQVAVSLNGAGASTFSPTDLVYVSGQGGNDAFTVNFGSTLTTPTAIAGSNSSGDTLTVNGDGSATNVITKTPGQITWGNPVTETVLRNGIPNTVITANGTSQNYINDPGGSTTINGGPGANTITITATTGSGVVIKGGPRTNTYIVDLGSLAGPVTIQNNNNAATNNLVVNGAAGNNTIVVVGNQITAAAQTITDTASLANLTVNGGSGNNQVSVSALTVPVQNLALNGGGGTNTFTLNNVGSTVGALAITGGSGTPGSTVVQVQGSLPATVTAQQLPPLVNAGASTTVDVWSPFYGTASFSDPSAAGTYTATANYGDGTGVQPLALGTGNTLPLSHAYAAPGVYTVTVSVVDRYGTGSSALTVTVRPQSIYVLDASGSAALSLSGNAILTIPGRLMVDSSSATALTASGNAQAGAGSIQVVGGVSKSGSAAINGTLHTGAATFTDPLAVLSGPGTTGLNSYNSASYRSGSHSLLPGIYSQISASGTASLTLSPGLYLIEGGGFTVTGSASISGSGVTIYNTVSTYPKAGGTYGGITLSGSGTFSLTAATAPTNGAYPGILIFQPGANTRAISLGGNGVLGLNGTIYAPTAQVTVTGNAQLKGALIADRLSLSGSGVSTQVADGSAGSILDNANAGTLLAGNITVYVNDPSSYFTADELSRIQDAINTWDNLLAPFSVTISEVSDPTLANVVIDNGTTSAAGSAANGILGSFSSSGEITILQGWNWYAGADASAIGANQYDFQTVMAHELGHALGLGGSPDSTSPMYEILAAGIVRRAPTVADLNIPEAPAGADPEMAAGFHLGTTAMATAQNGIAVVAGTGGSASGPLSVPPGRLTVGGDSSPAVAGQGAVTSSQQSIVNSQAITSVGSQVSVAFQAIDQASEQGLIPWVNAESTEFVPALDSAGRDGAALGHEQPAPDTSPDPAHPVILNRDRIDNEDEPNSTPIGPTIPGQRTTDSALSDLANEMMLVHGRNAARLLAHPVLLAGNPVITEDGQAATKSEPDEFQGVPVLTDPMAQEKRAPRSAPFAARLAAILLLANLSGRPIASRDRKTFRNDHYWNKEARSKKE
jgi:uncharacterized repeat protein (TIGR03803 family)